MAKKKYKNVLVQLAKKGKRDYVTPEDVGEALKLHQPELVRYDLLRVLGGLEYDPDSGSYGSCEDPRLCAFVAARDSER